MTVVLAVVVPATPHPDGRHLLGLLILLTLLGFVPTRQTAGGGS